MWPQLFLLLVFARSIFALTLTVTASSSTSANVQCKTKLSKSPVEPPIPTETTTKTGFPELILVFSASTPVTTITPPTATATATSYTDTTITTTASTVTDTFSTTSTETDFSTTTTTFSYTDTTTFSTTVTNTGTTTIPTPAGFESVQESSGDTNLKKHDVLGGSLLRSRQGQNNGNNPFDYRSPAEVKCVDHVSIIYFVEIIDVKQTSTSTAPTPTSTSTSTITNTSTSTIVPADVSTTLSFSTTETITLTSTESTTFTTSTTTTITASATVTSYAACAPTNLLGPQIANGDYLTYTDPSFNNQLYEPSVSDPESCCVACITSDNNCGYGVFSLEQGYCLLIEGTPTCNNPGFTAGKLYETTGSNEFNEYNAVAFSRLWLTGCPTFPNGGVEGGGGHLRKVKNGIEVYVRSEGQDTEWSCLVRTQP